MTARTIDLNFRARRSSQPGRIGRMIAFLHTCAQLAFYGETNRLPQRLLRDLGMTERR